MPLHACYSAFIPFYLRTSHTAILFYASMCVLHEQQEGEIIQLVRRGFFRVDKPASGDEGPHLVLIPDGKAKSMSTLSTALPHH